MGVETVLSNLTAGELAPELESRIDLEKFTQGVKTATNMTIMPYGGMKRRPGLKKLNDGKISDEAKLHPFVFNKSQSYVILLRPNFIDIFRDGVLKATVASPYTTIEQIREVDTVQSADTMILVHEDVQPYKLMRQGSDTVWDMSAITFVEIPTFDFGTGAEPVWSVARGWPRCCTFHKGRLWLAGSTEKPNSIWGSKINGFYDFGLGTSLDDEGIFDTLDTDAYYIIEQIFSGRTLQVFTSGGEFYNKSTIITPSDSVWSSETNYGATKIRPVMIDGATLFIDSSARNVRQFIYDYNEDGYISRNISLLSSHLLTDIKSISAIKGTSSDVSDFVYCINGDGTVAVLNTMRLENITGWTHWETNGEFIDVAVVGKSTYFLVKREATYFLEELDPNLYTDHAVIQDGTRPTEYNIAFNTDNVIFNSNNVIWTDYSTGTPITQLQTDYDLVFANDEFKVIADYSIQADATYIGTSGNNYFLIDRNAYRLEVGLNFVTNVTTLPINQFNRAGATLFKRKRVVKVDIDVLNTLGVKAKDLSSPDKEFVVILDETPELFSGFREMYLLGYDRLVEIEISQTQPLPFTLRSLGYEIVS